MNDLLIPLLALLLIILVAACSEGINESASKNHSQHLAVNAPTYDMRYTVSTSSRGTEDATTTVDYWYDVQDRTLHLVHRNALLPEDPSGIDVRIDLVENILTVIETGSIPPGESGDYYDIHMTITGLSGSVYRILYVEPNSRKNDLPLTFRMDLAEHTQGSLSRPQSVMEPR